MTRPRAQLVSLEATPYYHCIARCVRRAWLCGDDPYTGKNFDHRKPWLLKRVAVLAEVFAIDIAAYAVMSNHYHLVLHVDSARATGWTDDEVIRRWTRLFAGAHVARQHLQGECLSEAEKVLLTRLVELWRDRLASLSWFMRCLNEYLARRANAEDGCKGRFWEARFESWGLLDESALLSCMTYVDLNPIRAGIAVSLEQSAFTSIQARIQAVGSAIGGSARDKPVEDFKPRLMPFAEAMRQPAETAAIPYNLRDYLDLVDWTGRIVRQDKKGHIAPDVPTLLSRFGLSANEWQMLALQMQKQSIAMLHGLDRLAMMRKKHKAVAETV